MNGMTFNGERRDYLTILRGRERPTWAPLERDILEAPGVPGGYLGGTNVKPRALKVPVLLESKNFIELQKMKEDFAEWMVTDEPKELIFDDEPDRKYYAMVDEGFDAEEIIRVGAGFLNFICLDPFKYGEEEEEESDNDVTLINIGSLPTYPLVEVEIKEPTTFVAIGNGEDVNMIGKYKNVEEIPYVPQQRILWDQMGSLVGWTDGQNVEDGIVSGQMLANEHQFYATDYGEGSHWHGPAMKKSLTESLQDFRIDALVSFEALTPRDVGRVSITALDEQGNTIAHAQIRKPFTYEHKNYGYFQSGNGLDIKTIALMQADSNWMWNSFIRGLLRIERIGNRWYCYMTTLSEKGTHMYPLGRYIMDIEEKYSNKIRQIQVHIARYADYPVCWQRIDDIKVYKINNKPDEIEYIAMEGDIVTFDHVNNIIYKNGESIKDKKTFSSKYFPIDKGLSGIQAEPSESIDKVKVRWTPRWH